MNNLSRFRENPALYSFRVPELCPGSYLATIQVITHWAPLLQVGIRLQIPKQPPFRVLRRTRTEQNAKCMEAHAGYYWGKTRGSPLCKGNGTLRGCATRSLSRHLTQPGRAQEWFYEGDDGSAGCARQGNGEEGNRSRRLWKSMCQEMSGGGLGLLGGGTQLRGTPE